MVPPLTGPQLVIAVCAPSLDENAAQSPATLQIAVHTVVVTVFSVKPTASPVLHCPC